VAEFKHSKLMSIQKILKSANEIIALKKSLGTDAAPWSMLDCLRTACSENKAIIVSCNEWENEASIRVGVYLYGVSIENGRWVNGLI
jgi:hypothetical protein